MDARAISFGLGYIRSADVRSSSFYTQRESQEKTAGVTEGSSPLSTEKKSPQKDPPGGLSGGRSSSKQYTPEYYYCNYYYLETRDKTHPPSSHSLTGTFRRGDATNPTRDT